MKHVFVHAYLENNLGDDLFVRILCNRYPHVQFHVYTYESYKKKFKDIENCHVHCSTDPDVQKINTEKAQEGIHNGFRNEMIKYCKNVIHIGGSAFVQHFDEWSAFFDTDVELVELSNRMYLIGANFGPYKDENYHKQYHDLFKKYKGICFRDQYSKKLFQDITHVSYAPDVLWSIPVDVKAKEKKVVFAPIELSFRNGKWGISDYKNQYLDFHIKMVRTFIKLGYKISFLGFCESQQDGVIIWNICQALTEIERQNVRSMMYENDAELIIREFEDAEIVVGTRFHSIIMGLRCECKVLPIIYDHKTRITLADLAYPYKLELDELEHVSVDDYCKELKEASVYPVEKLVRESEKQFQYTDKFLNGFWSRIRM